jgi:hypothetical protein
MKEVKIDRKYITQRIGYRILVEREINAIWIA